MLISFTATLVEDLFRAGRLVSVAIDDDAPVPTRRVHDLEMLLDRLAVAKPLTDAPGGGGFQVAKQNVMTFAPDGARGVAVFVDGQKAASV